MKAARWIGVGLICACSPSLQLKVHHQAGGEDSTPPNAKDFASTVPAHYSGQILLNATSVDEAVELKWNPSGEGASYEIERADYDVRMFKVIARVDSQKNLTTQGYSDSQGLRPEHRYIYRVRNVATGDSSWPIVVNTSRPFVVEPGHSLPQLVGGYQWALPAARFDAVSAKRNHVFKEGEDVILASRWGNSARYEVRNYFGDLVAKGVTGTANFKIPVKTPGWYKIYFYSPNGESDAVLGDAIGGTSFVIFRKDHRFPEMPAPGQLVRPETDEVIRGVTAMGPQRHNVKNASDPEGEIARLAPDIEIDKDFYVGRDPQRKRDLLMVFSNGTTDLVGVRKIVERFHSDVKYWEGRNEPNFFMSADQYAQEFIEFAKVVRDVDPNAKLIGPGAVDISTGYGLAYLRDFILSLKGRGGLQYLSAISFHCYNNVNGDLSLARRFLDQLQALLKSQGLENIEKWQTEQGYFATLYGSFQPRHQGNWQMMQNMVFEQYGIPKEHNHLWYDLSGFWDVPAQFEISDDGQLMPVVPLMRVYSEELFGKTFKKAYDFGRTGNKLFIGNLFRGTTQSVAAFMSAGDTYRDVELKVKGASKLHVVSALGETSELVVQGGRARLRVADLPVYVEFRNDQEVEVVPMDWGVNLAQSEGVSLSSSSDGTHPANASYNNDLSKVTNGVLDTWYWDSDFNHDVWYDHTPEAEVKQSGAWVEFKWPRPQRLGRVVVYSSVPWSWRGTLLDYELQYLNQKNRWVTIEHVIEDPRTFAVHSAWLHSTVDSFASDRSIFVHEFTPVVAERIRVLAHEFTYGGGATADVARAGGQTGFHVMNLREIEVYAP